MPRNGNKQRGATKAAAKVVKHAMRKEHGFTSSRTGGDLPAYRTTKILQYSCRFNSMGKGTTRINLASILGAIGNPTADVKLDAVTCWIAPFDSLPTTAQDAVTLSISSKGEKQEISGKSRRDKYTRLVIHPPLDDWYTAVNGDIAIDIVNAGTGQVVVDISTRARVSIPEVQLEPEPVSDFVTGPVSSWATTSDWASEPEDGEVWV